VSPKFSLSQGTMAITGWKATTGEKPIGIGVEAEAI
jgi:hypothetical protein